MGVTAGANEMSSLSRGRVDWGPCWELRPITSSLRREKRAAAWGQGVAGSGWGLENSHSQCGVVAGCSERPGVGPADTGSPPHRSSWLGDFAPGRQPLRLCAE